MVGGEVLWAEGEGGLAERQTHKGSGLDIQLVAFYGCGGVVWGLVLERVSPYSISCK
jgi:hypothetical protein